MRILLLTLIFLFSSSAVAEVYRSVDEDGNVTYSDKPSPGAEKIRSDKVQTVDKPDLPNFRYTPPPDQVSDKPVYEKISITYPENDTSISQNDGNFSVNVSLQPGLKSSHKLALSMDGEEIASGQSSSFALSNVDRGTHTLVATVKGSGGQVIIQSEPVTFTLHRHSIQHPPPPPPPKPAAP